MNKKIGFWIQAISMMTGIYLLFGLRIASAHVTVGPSEVEAGKYQTFTVEVHNERSLSITGVRLLLPAGLEIVSPSDKPGWNVEVKRIGVSMKGEILNTGMKAPDPDTATEIIWTGKSLPQSEMDEFLFSAKVSSGEEALIWKAYQTYADGTVVAWDQDPKEVESMKDEDSHETNTFSVTRVVSAPASAEHLSGFQTRKDEGYQLSVLLPALAVIIGGFIIGIALRRKS